MGKRFSSSFDSEVPVEDLFAVLSGEDWAATKAAHLGDDSRVLSHEVGADGSVKVVMSRRLPDGVPGVLQKFLPADQRVTTTDSWGPEQGSARHGTWSAHIDGAPATLGGTMRIEPLAHGNRYTIEGEVKVSVPLIGGKAEAFIAEQIVRLAQKERDVVEKVIGS
jgi:hypothetical protein